ncbi:MAG: SLC13 family permease [Bacteroidales bacterium]|nr:SLC13 family permease [Bacteroidales bacterium]
MTLESYIVALVILFLVVSLYLNKIGSGLTFVIAIAILGTTGILTPKEMIAGFANEQIAVILMLMLLGETVRKSGILDAMFERIFSKTTTYKGFLTKLMILVSAFSAFLNNTPLVAILMPYTKSWSKKNNIPLSKLLIPLSYAAILGGTATLIGTSTNLVVAGMVADQKIIPNLKPLEIFDFSPVGVTMIILGITYMIVMGNKLLPSIKSRTESAECVNREYFAEVRITNSNQLKGKTVEEAGLRNLQGLFLVEILRDGRSIRPVGPTTTLKQNDHLLFAGATETIADMVETQQGFELEYANTLNPSHTNNIVEVVISYNSSFIGRTAKEIQFRGKFNAAIIGIHRNGERLSGKIGNVKLEAGDLLLLVTGNDFNQRLSDTADIYPLTNLREIKKVPLAKQILLIGGIVLAAVASTLGIVKLFTAILLLLILVIISNLTTPKEIVKNIDFNLIFIIALSLAMGTAMLKTGVADTIAETFLSVVKPFGVIGVLAGIFILTSVLGSIITNKAAVAILFPVALNLALTMELNPKPFILTVAFAGAASFLTPVGYQTNLMVYGPGGYRFDHFLKIGWPLTIIYMITTVFGLIWQFNLPI